MVGTNMSNIKVCNTEQLAEFIVADPCMSIDINRVLDPNGKHLITGYLVQDNGTIRVNVTAKLRDHTAPAVFLMDIALKDYSELTPIEDATSDTPG